MRRTAAIVPVLLLVCMAIAGCTPKSGGEPLTVCTFSGENEQFILRNGVIVLSPEEEVFYGGTLEAKPGQMPDIGGYSTTWYVLAEGERKTLLDNRVVDETGGALSLSGAMGKITGEDVFQGMDLSQMQDNLYFELTTVDLDGAEQTYQMQMSLVEIT